ncbi:MAG: bifunctional DNA-binding transcriptional regulator [Acidimicrobiales bacterium]|jgi:bifunctional DNA-binding transcriptional regulator/antitoxin component of YhaV-PrlF toxin-antitoxin module
MEKQTISHTKTRKLSKVASGSTYSVTLPIEFIRHLKWKEKQKLDVTLEGDTLIIKDWKMKKRV